MRSICLSGMLWLLVGLLPANAAEQPRYGGELQGFAYPHPRHQFALSSQGQSLTMAYMDVAPTVASNGRTAVLLHGKNFCAATWDETVQVLSGAGYRVIAPDQVGFCGSSKPRGYQFSFAQLATNTQALLQSLEMDRVTLVGHSMGGMLAVRFALMYPQAVEKLVLVNPIGLEDWQLEGVPYATIDALLAGERKTTAESIKAYQRKYYYNGQWAPRYDRWVEMLAGMYAGPDGEVVALNQAQASEMLFTQPIVHELPRLRVPTALIIGGRDRTAPGANRAPASLSARLGDYPVLGQRAADAIPGARLVSFPELGHSPQVEAPHVFHQALLRELAGAKP